MDVVEITPFAAQQRGVFHTFDFFAEHGPISP
jgi:hypothetical protein